MWLWAATPVAASIAAIVVWGRRSHSAAVSEIRVAHAVFSTLKGTHIQEVVAIRKREFRVLRVLRIRFNSCTQTKLTKPRLVSAPDEIGGAEKKCPRETFLFILVLLPATTGCE